MTVAKLSDFPKQATDINFDRYALDTIKLKERGWTSKTVSEYYIEKASVLPESYLINIICAALNGKGYAIQEKASTISRVVGQRGMRMNEWNSLTAVYYRLDSITQKTQIYITTRITQDGTGGWAKNRAREVGLLIEKEI